VHFSNKLLFALLIVVPYFVSSKLGGGFKTWVFFLLITALPILMAFWTLSATLSPRKNEMARFPGKPIEHYLTFKTAELKEKYIGKTKIPMETFHEAYFKGEVDFNGDCLEALEYRHDWAQFKLTWGNYWFFLTGFLPEMIVHSRSQGWSIDFARDVLIVSR
jgi:sphingolipid C9-methyltransferase